MRRVADSLCGVWCRKVSGGDLPANAWLLLVPVGECGLTGDCLGISLGDESCGGQYRESQQWGEPVAHVKFLLKILTTMLAARDENTLPPANVVSATGIGN